MTKKQLEDEVVVLTAALKESQRRAEAQRGHIQHLNSQIRITNWREAWVAFIKLSREALGRVFSTIRTWWGKELPNHMEVSQMAYSDQEE